MSRLTLLTASVLTIMLGAPGIAAAADPALEMHVLNRLAFGPDEASRAAIHRMGVDAWIDQQLHPDEITEPASLTNALDSLDTTKLDTVALFERFRPPPQATIANDPDAAKEARKRARIVPLQAGEARLMRAIESPRQLQEVMVDFWFNHFNVYAGKGLDRLWIGDYENSAIRPHVLGRFRDLLEATARHPAMQFYLDNWQNTAPGSPGAKGKETGLNENYAREIMELHTLGVDGGYTQDDVTALARILTGWGIVRPRQLDQNPLVKPGKMPRVRYVPSDNGFAFDPARHDFGDKLFLGETIHGSGIDEVEQALDMLAKSPATARHISYELAQYFIDDDPPAPVVHRLTRAWMETDGDIAAVLKVLFERPEFRDPKAYGAKFKTPFEYVVSAVRASGVPVTNFRPLFGTMKQLGEPLYGCQTPDGYKNTRDAWLNPDAMALRISFATGLGSGHLPLDKPQPEPADDDMPAMSPPATPAMPQTVDAPSQEPATPLDDVRLASLLGPLVSTKTKTVVSGADPKLKAALLLGSPDFMAR